jgi:hypothetical protein
VKGATSFLLRHVLKLLLDGAEIYAGRMVLARLKRRLVEAAAFYFALTVLGLAAAAFFYVLLFLWLASRFDDITAAAVLLGASLLLIGLLVLVRALSSRRPPRRRPAATAGQDLLARLTEQGEFADPDLQAAMALGKRIAGHMRKSAPVLALGAAVLGFAIGLRPELLDLLRRAERKQADD